MRARVLLVAVLSTALISACTTAGPSAPAPPRKPPVVVLVFDEFPLDTLLRPDGSIDAERYPNFARLAETSTWFPNAHTVYDSTFKAVPAILDSKLPRRGTAADFRSHRQNIYTLVDGLGYGVVDVESGEAPLPAADLPGRPHPAPGGPGPAGRWRPPRPPSSVDRSHPKARPAHALLPARAPAPRALALPALGARGAAQGE